MRTLKGDSIGYKIRTKIISSAGLTSECWSIQFWGLPYCRECEYLATEDCGGIRIGKDILLVNIQKRGYRIEATDGGFMAISFAGYQSFKLRQLTGIPLSRICEAACEIAYDTLLERPDLLQETIRKYSIRSPERQLEIDLSRGYLKVID